MSSPEQWYKALPPLTRWMFTLAFALTVATSWGLVEVPSVVYSAEQVFRRFHVWRLVTPFCYCGGFSMAFVFRLYRLYNYASAYEPTPFNTGGGGHASDFATALLFCVACLVAADLCVPMMLPRGVMRSQRSGEVFEGVFMVDSFIAFILFIWSKYCQKFHPERQVSLFMVKLPVVWLPYAFLFLQMCMGQSVMADVLGMVIGQLYYVLVVEVPQHYNTTLIRTPRFLFDFFAANTNAAPPMTRAAPPAAGRPPSEPAFAAPGAVNRHNWGSGRVLGGGGGGGGGGRRQGHAHED